MRFYTPKKLPGISCNSDNLRDTIYSRVLWLLRPPVFYILFSASTQDGPGDDFAQVSVLGDFSMALSTFASLWYLFIQNKGVRAENELRPGKAIVSWV